MSTSATVEGGCLCGAVRYAARGVPSHPTLCHCRSCRGASGAPMVAWVTFPASGFSFVKGTPVRFRSSTPVIRTFCGACGTPLTYVYDAFPDGVDVTTCSLDDPEPFAPTDHTWISHRLSWMNLEDGRSRFQRTRQEG